MKILVVGGAGYIGSHMVKQLLRGGHDVMTLDDLSTGYRDAVLGGSFIQGSIADRTLLDRVFADHRFDAVFHFASFIQVGESVAQPAKYYANNLANTLNLLDAMVRHEIRHFIFSSSAAIFGEPRNMRIDEDHPVAPINPYGASKAMVEQILRDYDRAYGLKSVSLRYFNACGADPEGDVGERHDPETHLIPLALQAVSGRRESLTVFGRDYDTPDGTCIRDYVHVCDLCEAHLLALVYLQDGKASNAFNLGNGDGFSVQEVINTVSLVTGKKVPVIDGLRRAGDPARLVADASKANKTLGWKPRYGELDVIVSHAWAWETKRLGLGI
jgi:UDP-glucose 4-epimerase